MLLSPVAEFIYYLLGQSLGKDTYVLLAGRRSLGKYNDVLRALERASVGVAGEMHDLWTTI